MYLGIGLKHIVEAASVHENQIVRGAYIRVFTEVLSRRVDINFAVDEKIPSYEDLLLELMEMLLASDHELGRLLCSNVRGKEAEDIARSILILLESSSNHRNIEAMKLLDWIVEYEVNNTPRIGTLFRSETMCTKLMGLFFSTKGKKYLVQVLSTPVQQYLSSSLNLEIDPNKGVDINQLETNMINLKYHTNLFLQAILESISYCPVELKHILEILRISTSRKFGGTEGCDRIAVAGYTFLRFFCPAIALPGKYSLTGSVETDNTPLTRQQSRGLLLIAKILQNLANGTHFTEECMEPLNSWIDSYATEISYFSFEISTEKSFENDNNNDIINNNNQNNNRTQVDSDDETIDDDNDDVKEENNNTNNNTDNNNNNTKNNNMKKNNESDHDNDTDEDNENDENDDDDDDVGDGEDDDDKNNENKTSQQNNNDIGDNKKLEHTNDLTEQEISAMTIIHKCMFNNQERIERILNNSSTSESKVIFIIYFLYLLLYVNIECI